MSDYENMRYGRNYPRSVDTGGRGLFWLLVVVASLGLLVFVSALGNRAGPESHIAPADLGASATVGGAVVD
jgi:hypothetical protein